MRKYQNTMIASLASINNQSPMSMKTPKKKPECCIELPEFIREIDPDDLNWSKNEKAQGLEANKLYRAKSSGFVTAFSHGDNPTHGTIYSGSKPNKNKLLRRTRFTDNYDGSMLWIRKNEYWVVRTPKGKESGVIVQWILFF